MTVFASYSSFRFRFLRPVLEGEPVIVLERGEPVKKNLDRNRITVDELCAAARLEGYGQLDEVEWPCSRRPGRSASFRSPSR